MLDKTSMLYYFFDAGYFLHILVGFPLFLLCIYGCLYIIESSYKIEI